MKHQITAPSGLAVTVREFNVEDEDLLGDKRLARDGLAMTSLLDAITISLDSPGPYRFNGDRPAWREVLQGDTLAVILANRIQTWPDEPYDHKQPCPNCKEPTTTTVDLEKIPVRALPESSVAHVSTGVPLQVALPRSGALVSYRLLRGKDEKDLEKIQKQNEGTRRMSSYLRFRVSAIEVDKKPVDQAALPDFIRKLPAADSSFLRAAFDAADCGIDTEWDLACDRCSHAWREEVRLGAGFLFPKYRAKNTTK